MTESLTKTLTGVSGGLGRPPRAPAKRSSRPRFAPVDIIWLVAAFLVSVISSELTNGLRALSEPSTYLAAAAAAVIYWLGWLVRDRSTGVIAAALVAASPAFSASAAAAPSAVICVLFLAASIAASISQMLVLSVVLAAAATVASPDGVLLGAILLALALNARHPRAVTSVLLYLLIVATGWMAVVASGSRPLGGPSLHPNAEILRLFLAGSAASWFFWPFLADLAEPTRRQRWKLIVLWAVLYVALESLVVTESSAARLIIAAPFFALMQAGGMARLIPVVASDFMSPRSRYVLATAAVVFLVLLKTAAEWPSAHAARVARVIHTGRFTPSNSKTQHPEPLHAHPSTTTATPVATVPRPLEHAAPPAPAPTSHVLVPSAIPHHVVVVPVVPTPTAPGVSAALLMEARQYDVPTTTGRYGHSAPRSRWAIEWAIKQAQAAAHPVVRPVKPAASVAHVRPAPIVTTSTAAARPAAAVRPTVVRRWPRAIHRWHPRGVVRPRLATRVTSPPPAPKKTTPPITFKAEER